MENYATNQCVSNIPIILFLLRLVVLGRAVGDLELLCVKYLGVLIDLAINILLTFCSSLWHLKVDNGQFEA